MLLVSTMLWIAAPAIGEEQKTPEHPLLPGVRSSEVWNEQWPGTLHDKLLTGFSPLKCGMKQAPKIWATIRPAGVASYAAFLADERGETFLLVQDCSLRRVDAEGQIVWSYPCQSVLFYDKLHGDGTYTLGVQDGDKLVLLDPRTGRPFWARTFDGALGVDKVRVGKVHPDYPGKQIVVFPQYVTAAYLFGFQHDNREPELVWKADNVGVANWPDPADHGAATIIEPDGSVIWNIRHHTINTFDPKTGKLLRRFEFKSGGGLKRNYGPSVIGLSGDGAPVLAISGQHIQHHLTCFTRSRSTPPTQTIDRFFGEIYKPAEAGVGSRFPVSGLGDADGDGGLDVVYAIRSVKPKPHTHTVVCDVGTGKEQTIPDTWLAGVADIDADGRKEIFVYADPKAEAPERGMLHVYRFNEARKLVRVHTSENAQLVLRPQSPTEQPHEAAWCHAVLETPVILPTATGSGVLIRDLVARQAKLLLLKEGKVNVQATPADLFEAEVLAIGAWKPGGPLQLAVQSPSGQLRVVLWDGRLRFEKPLEGAADIAWASTITPGDSARVSAADLTGNGRCELIVRTLRRLEIHAIDSDGRATLAWSAPFVARNTRLSVPVGDINGDGRANVLGTGKTADGRLSVRLHAADGETVWETPLPISSAANIVKWIVGDFFGPAHPGIFVSVRQARMREESYVLDGEDGRIVWTGQPQVTPRGIRACRPQGIPTVFDADADGKEDLMLDYLDYLAIHRGSDGKFIHNVSLIPGGGYYSSFTRLYKQGQSKPHFLIPLGHNGVGLIAGDLRTEVWSHKPGYDTPQKVGMVDVDGDGRLEVGYEEKRDGWFVCRDLWTGGEEWRLKLEGAHFGSAITADIDGDGKGEFLIGGYCIGTDAKGQGTIRWRLDLSAKNSWPAIADFDGDGLGDIVLPGSDGLVRVLKARSD